MSPNNQQGEKPAYSFKDEMKRLVAPKSQFTVDVSEAAQQVGVDPKMLLASSYVEGFNRFISGQSGKSAYFNKGVQNKGVYSFDGFGYAGLDKAGEMADGLKQKGYLPQDFDFQPFKAVNEKGQTVTSGAFKSPKDALIMKAAILRNEKDKIEAYAKQKGIEIKTEHMDYFIMSAYNGGFVENVAKMVDQYGVAQDKDNFVKNGETTRKGVHRNVAQRMELLDMAEELLR